MHHSAVILILVSQCEGGLENSDLSGVLCLESWLYNTTRAWLHTHGHQAHTAKLCLHLSSAPSGALWSAWVLGGGGTQTGGRNPGRIQK